MVTEVQRAIANEVRAALDAEVRRLRFPTTFDVLRVKPGDGLYLVLVAPIEQGVAIEEFQLRSLFASVEEMLEEKEQGLRLMLIPESRIMHSVRGVEHTKAKPATRRAKQSSKKRRT